MMSTCLSTNTGPTAIQIAQIILATIVERIKQHTASVAQSVNMAIAELAKPIIAKLVEELKNHSMTSVQALSEAVSDLTAILTGNLPSITTH